MRNSRRRGVGWEKAAIEWSITRPTAEKLKLQLTALDKKLDVKAAELQAHKEIMMRSRYTAEGLKAATAKRTKLENELGSLQSEAANFVLLVLLLSVLSLLSPSIETWPIEESSSMALVLGVQVKKIGFVLVAILFCSGVASALMQATDCVICTTKDGKTSCRAGFGPECN